MNKALIIIKSPGIGDLQILLSYIHHVSKEINKPVSILAQKGTAARSIFKHDKHVDDVIDLGRKDFFNIINIVKSKKFDQAYIYSDSLRLYLIARLSGISKIYHYPFFSKKGKNFYKTAQEFTEKYYKKKLILLQKFIGIKNLSKKLKKIIISKVMSKILFVVFLLRGQPNAGILIII